jgi:hypothetical protein
MFRTDPAMAPAFELASRGVFVGAAAHARRVLRAEWSRSLNVGVLDEIVRWHVAAGDMRGLRDDVLPAYLAAAGLAGSFDEREARSMHAYYLAQDVLDHGEVELALELLRLGTSLSLNPMLRHTVGMFDSYFQLKDDAVRRAHVHLDPDRPAYVISSVVWGPSYIDNYLNYMVRSLLAPGNLPGLRDYEIYFSIVTTPEGRDRIRQHRAYGDMCAYGQVHFFLFPEELTEVGNPTAPGDAYYQLYGVMDHVSIAFAKALGAGIFLLPVDCIVATGSLRGMVARIEQGYEAVGMTNLVAKREHFLPQLDKEFGTAPVLAAAPRQLANLALTCLHQESFGNLVTPENPDFSLWARDMFWPTDGGIHSRCLFVHPLCVSATAIGRDFQQCFKWVDRYLASALFPEEVDFEKFYLVRHTDEAYITNFATEARKFANSGKPFTPLTFAEGNPHSRAINRWFLTQPQLIACDAPMRTTRDPNADVAEVLGHMQRLHPL